MSYRCSAPIAGTVCEITLTSRNRCQFCRFKKCQAVGMKKEFVQNERSRMKDKFFNEEKPDITSALNNFFTENKRQKLEEKESLPEMIKMLTETKSFDGGDSGSQSPVSDRETVAFMSPETQDMVIGLMFDAFAWMKESLNNDAAMVSRSVWWQVFILGLVREQLLTKVTDEVAAHIDKQISFITPDNF